jgi:hypothetical protein
MMRARRVVVSSDRLIHASISAASSVSAIADGTAWPASWIAITFARYRVTRSAIGMFGPPMLTSSLLGQGLRCLI